jgi:ATP-dependent protease HslVU (ClpYQ) peptidase subunit
MTCIVGLVHNGSVFIGGDSAGTSGWDLTIRRDPKVFRNGPYLIGYTSSFRMGQLLRFNLTVADQDPRHGDEQHMMTVFIDAVRQCFKDGGYAKIESSQENGGVFLVGYRGVLYEVENDFQVGVPDCQYQAVGCGDQVARGALFASTIKSPTERIKVALQAAEQFSAGVRGPFIVEELTP